MTGPLHNLRGGAAIPLPVIRSGRFNGTDESLSRAVTTTENQTAWTLSAWVCPLKNVSSSTIVVMAGETTAASRVYVSLTNNKVHVQYTNSTSQNVFFKGLRRDFGRFGHLILVWDTANSTEADRLRAYWNGERLTLDSGTMPPANHTSSINTSGESHIIGRVASSGFWDGYLSQVAFLSGSTMTDPLTLGERHTEGNATWWAARKTADLIALADAAGSNSFVLDFEALGADASAKGNNFTASNMAAENLSEHGPNDPHSLWNLNEVSDAVITENGRVATGVGADVDAVRGTLYAFSGLLYFEIERVTDSGGSDRFRGGLANAIEAMKASTTSSSNSWTYSENGNKTGGGAADTAHGSAIPNTGTLGVIANLDLGAVWFTVDGAYQNSATAAEIEAGTTTNAAFTNVVGPVAPFATLFSTEAIRLRVEKDDWQHTPPTGYKPWSHASLPRPKIQGADVFNTLLYTPGGGNDAFTGVGFQPSMSWFKPRTGTIAHRVFDAVRGTTSGNQELTPNGTGAEGGGLSTGLTFDSDGFTFNVGVGGDDRPNLVADGASVCWSFAANGAGVANSDGSINSTVSAHSAGHFSIVSYTGTSANGTVGHGLPGAPGMVFVKTRTSAVSWRVWHRDIAAADFLALDTNAVATTAASTWNSTAPNATLISLGTASASNNTGDNFIAYAFRDVPGLCKIGSYTGNGTASGPFIHCGFRPGWILVKRTDVAADWVLADLVRNNIDEFARVIFANTTGTETSTGDWLRIFADGFKPFDAEARLNASGGTYVFVAIADAVSGDTMPPLPAA